MDKREITEFAQKNGYDDAIYLGKWRDYETYEPIIEGPSEESPVVTGPPLIILVYEDTIRMSTPEEGHTHIREVEEIEEV